MILVSSELAAACPTACKPGSNGKQGLRPGTATIGFGPGFSAADIAAFREGIQMWNDFFIATWSELYFDHYSTGPAQIMIVIDPDDSLGGAVNATDTYGHGVIQLSPRYLNQNKRAFWRHLIAHELGHSLALANVATASCNGVALMYGKR